MDLIIMFLSSRRPESILRSSHLTLGQKNLHFGCFEPARAGLADSPMASSVTSPKRLPNWPDVTCSDVGANLEDWRTPLLRYLRDSSVKI